MIRVNEIIKLQSMNKFNQKKKQVIENVLKKHKGNSNFYEILNVYGLDK